MLSIFCDIRSNFSRNQKRLAKEFEREFTCLGENTEPFEFHQKKKLQQLLKIEKKSQKTYTGD